MAVLSFPVLMFVLVCVFIPCVALILTWGCGPFLTFASASLSPAKVHLWEDSIPNLPNGFLSSLPKFFLWHWHQSEGKRSAVRLLDQSVHVSANSIRNVLWPLTLTPLIRLTSTWVCSCDANITRECWIKALLQVKSDYYFFLFWKESSHFKNLSELFSFALIILSPHWLTVWRAAAIMP